MTTMIESLAVEAVSQDTAQNEVPEAAQAAQEKASPAKRRKYSGNDVLRLRKALDEARMDMDKQCLSMNDVVHILQDRLDEMLKTRKCSCADLARIITMAGCPVTERTLKDYLAKARKDAKEGNTDYRELKEHILSQAAREECKNCANNDAPSPSSDDASDAQDGADDFAIPGNDWLASAISSAMDSNDTMAVAKQHVQDIFAARKLRKKTRNTQKHR